MGFVRGKRDLQSRSTIIKIDPGPLPLNHALEKVPLLKPDLVLMDLSMPEMNGLDATRAIKAHADGPRVIILTLHDNPEYRAAAADVRADGFVTKTELDLQLLPLIHELFA